MPKDTMFFYRVNNDLEITSDIAKQLEQIEKRLWNRLREELFAQIREQLNGQLREHLREQLRNLLNKELK